ncbi:sugar kinase [Halobacillus fulvus]|nr:sugar kinase [Halobacillus fulvus]
MKPLDVVTLGETMVLFSSEEQKPLQYVHQMKKQMAGAESNVAIALARLNYPTGWISKLGADPFGTYIRNTIRGEGVDTSHVTFTNEAATGVFFKEQTSPEHVQVYYYRKNSAASLLTQEDLAESYLSQAKILHVTGITPALSGSCRQAVFHAIKVAKASGTTVVFDPNIRYKLWDSEEEVREVLMDIASLADVILPGVEEAEFLTGEKDYHKAAGSLRGRPEQTIVMKLGKEGAYYESNEGSGFVDGFQVDRVVDPVGAGDGFAAGVISGLIDGIPIEEAVRRGNAIGAHVVQMAGDIEGLPNWRELEQMLTGEQRSVDVER